MVAKLEKRSDERKVGRTERNWVEQWVGPKATKLVEEWAKHLVPSMVVSLEDWMVGS
jgi:hypothetical protein